MIRNIIHLLHYLVAGLGSVYDNIKNNFIKSKIV
jgi:hypothetical protein